MSVKLIKGGNIVLTKAGSRLQRVVVACGWDANQSHGPAYDLDLTAAALDASGKVPSTMDPADPEYQLWFVHANHRETPNNCITFMGDNRTGEGEGDDELMTIDLRHVPDNIESILFAVVIWLALQRMQKFGNVHNAFIRVFDESNPDEELARYDLGADFSEETLVVFGELYRRGDEWKFRAVGQGYDAADYRKQYGIVRAFETEYARGDKY